MDKEIKENIAMVNKYILPEWCQSTTRLRTIKNNDVNHIFQTDLTKIELDSLLKEWEIETDECDAHNCLVHKHRVEKYRQIIILAIEIWGKASNEAKYLHKAFVPSKPYLNFREQVLDKIEKFNKEKEEKLKKEEELKRKEQLSNEAVSWLLERGYKFDKDFNIQTAIEFADEVAFNEEVDKFQEGGYVDFYGDDYCEDCAGWNGKDHRCDCGNRRVCWTTGDSHSFKEPYIYAEAD